MVAKPQPSHQRFVLGSAWRHMAWISQSGPEVIRKRSPERVKNHISVELVDLQCTCGLKMNDFPPYSMCSSWLTLRGSFKYCEQEFPLASQPVPAWGWSSCCNWWRSWKRTRLKLFTFQLLRFKYGEFKSRLAHHEITVRLPTSGDSLYCVWPRAEGNEIMSDVHLKVLHNAVTPTDTSSSSRVLLPSWK